MGLFKNLFGKKEKPTLEQDIAEAKGWIAKTLNSSNYEADFSLNSLKEIDRFFDEQSTPNGLLNKNRGQRIFAIGVYIGEIIISSCKGNWATDDNDPQGEIHIAVKLPDGSVIWPVQRAMQRYQNGSEDSIYDYVAALIESAESKT